MYSKVLRKVIGLMEVEPHFDQCVRTSARQREKVRRRRWKPRVHVAYVYMQGKTEVSASEPFSNVSLPETFALHSRCSVTC